MHVQQIPEGLQSALSSLGHDLSRTPAEVAEYARSLLPRLQAASSEPNPQEAWTAARGLIVAYAAKRAVDQADAVDGRLWGAVHGVLFAALAGAGGR